MALFRTETQRDIWLAHWCERCWRNPDCPIVARALRRDRKPQEWERNPRAALMREAYKCNEFATKPPRTPKREQQFEDVSMFDDDAIQTGEVNLVPVEGWPDPPRRKDKEGDHA